MNYEDINNYLPSILNPRTVKKHNSNLSLTQNSTASRLSLSLKKSEIKNIRQNLTEAYPANKENFSKTTNFLLSEAIGEIKENGPELDSLGFSAVHDLNTIKIDSNTSILDYDLFIADNYNKCNKNKNDALLKLDPPISSISDSVSSEETLIYKVSERPIYSVNFTVDKFETVDINARKSNIKKVLVTCNYSGVNVDCELMEGSQLSEETIINNNNNMNDSLFSPPKRKAITVNLEIKKQKLTDTEDKDEEKILILNTNAIEKLKHIIVQPPNYKLVKRKIHDRNLIKTKQKSPNVSIIKHGKNYVQSDNLKQKSIETYFKSNIIKSNQLSDQKAFGTLGNDRTCVYSAEKCKIVRNDAQKMSRNSGVVDITGRTSYKTGHNETPRSPRISLPRLPSPKKEVKNTFSEAPRASSSRTRKESAGSLSPRKNIDTIHYSLPQKLKSNKTSVARSIPHHKIVAGTHFAVDAFSYGPIPNVKHYFLTHFHSDHYTGLNRNFNKLLFCSKITADLCVTNLGVNLKFISIINVNETVLIEGVEVTPVDANHCPGAVMLVFTLPNGKTILHTGDFRASEIMESYPVFWNKDVHTIYLDTTYCNPRYDFPTQDQSLEMALNLLRQKKMSIEKSGKKFSSVLIVCGTYTIGKEKFFHGVARRVGCSVWACPDKDRIMQTVEGRSYSNSPPQSCQLHVVPMRDLTHEKLHNYMVNLKGAFSEVVAFKPSGWENVKNSAIEKDNVTIYGIPYSEHSSFSELIRFVKFLKPKQVIPTVSISGGIKAVQKYFPCPLINKEDIQCQSRVTDYFSIQNKQQVPAVT